MRGIVLGAALALLAPTAPAFAQFGAPFGAGYGSPGLYSPEAAGAFGGGAANNAASQGQCQQSGGVGRDGPRGNCPPGRAADPPKR